MTKTNIILSIVVLLTSCLVATAQQQGSFDQAADSVHEKLQASIDELNALRAQAANEKIPLSRKLSELETELSDVRKEYQDTTRLLDSRTLDLSNLRSEIKSRQEESTYLSNLLSEYIRNFESRLHIAEIQRYREPLEEAKLAMDNSGLSEEQVYAAQTKVVSTSLERLAECLGGASFKGTAVDPSGVVKNGTFIMVGPAAIFQSDDGLITGTVEQRLGSLEPAIVPYGNELDTIEASNVISRSSGLLPFDPTLGNAHKIEETKETILSHIKKGGPVMYPIFIMAGTALLVALYKWIAMIFTIRKPSQRKIRNLLDAVAKHDEKGTQQHSKKIRGPVGRMLRAGIEHIKEPRELIEEIMYEKVLSARLKLERFLPFIAIAAASAPLLGLLGTVTGIINTFKLITVFGSGDVKTLSGGISEALITTEFGLIVAIPSLLLHAFLSRKAKSAINEMEKAAMAFINQISKTPYRQEKDDKNILAQLNAEQIKGLLQNMSDKSQAGNENYRPYPQDCAANIMNPRVVSVDKTATVAETIGFIRSVEIPEEIDTVFVVDEKGKYMGNVLVHHLLTKPEQIQIESLLKKNPYYARVNTHKNEVNHLFKISEYNNIPVLDDNDQLVGRIFRKTNGDGK